MSCKINSYGVIQWWWISSIILFNIVSSQERVGQFCKIRRTQAPGQCKLLINCKQAVDDLRLRGISPQVCRFEGVQPVVCCVEPTITSSTKEEGISSTVGNTSRQKCQEYREHSKRLSQLLFPGVDTEECGFMNPERDITENKAESREFPHMAAIGYDGKNGKEWLCVGALISENFVLTAAHCLHDNNLGEPKYARLGDLILNDDYDDSMPQEFNIIQTFEHPKFKSPSLYHNIALVKLDKPAFFDFHTLPACLETNPTVLSEKVIVAGWGRENFWTDMSPHLLKGNFDIFSSEECKNTYEDLASSVLDNGIEDATQVCAGPRVDHNRCVMGTGILQKYSSNVDCMYSLVGVASYSKACGIANVPEVFTRVSAYIGWIEGIVWAS